MHGSREPSNDSPRPFLRLTSSPHGNHPTLPTYEINHHPKTLVPSRIKIISGSLRWITCMLSRHTVVASRSPVFLMQSFMGSPIRIRRGILKDVYKATDTALPWTGSSPIVLQWWRTYPIPHAFRHSKWQGVAGGAVIQFGRCMNTANNPLWVTVQPVSAEDAISHRCEEHHIATWPELRRRFPMAEAANSYRQTAWHYHELTLQFSQIAMDGAYSFTLESIVPAPKDRLLLKMKERGLDSLPPYSGPSRPVPLGDSADTLWTH